MRALESAQLALELLIGLLRQVALGGLGAVAGDLVGEVVALAQLGMDRAQLLAQEVLALRAVHLLARLGGELLLHLEQVDLTLEQLGDTPQPHQPVGGLEQGLGVLELELEIGGGEIGEAAGVLEIGGNHHHLARDRAAEAGHLVELVLDDPHQGLGLHVLRRRRFGDALEPGREVGLGVRQIVDGGPRQPLHQDAHAPVGEPQHAHHQRGGADRMQITLAGVLGGGIALRDQHQHAMVGQRAIDRDRALLAAHRERQDAVGEEDGVLERKDRQHVRQ